jgi:hypothetical protein
VPSSKHNASRSVAAASLLLAASQANGAETDGGHRRLAETFARLCLADSAQSAGSIRRDALEAGWSPQAARVISTATGKRLDAGSHGPRFLRLGDLTLAVTEEGAGGYACSVSAPFSTALSVKRLALAVRGANQVDALVVVSDPVGERAIWKDGSDQIEASIRKDYSLRHARLLVRRPRTWAALRD